MGTTAFHPHLDTHHCASCQPVCQLHSLKARVLIRPSTPGMRTPGRITEGLGSAACISTSMRHLQGGFRFKEDAAHWAIQSK